MELTIDNTRLRKLIPGVIHEVRNESTLYDKLHPWLLSAKQWIEDEFLGPDFTPPPSILPLAEKIIVNRAFAQAILPRHRTQSRRLRRNQHRRSCARLQRAHRAPH